MGKATPPSPQQKMARLSPVLATSRAFGDFDLAPQVIATPDIIDVELGQLEEQADGTQSFALHSQWDCGTLLLASDGLWDVFESQRAGHLVTRLRKQGYTPQQISKELIRAAYRLGSGDNITAFVVFVDELLELSVR